MHKISIPKVMQSSAGYYIGREIYEDGCYIPYSRNSQYFKTEKEAQSALIDLDNYYIDDI